MQRMQPQEEVDVGSVPSIGRAIDDAL